MNSLQQGFQFQCIQYLKTMSGKQRECIKPLFITHAGTSSIIFSQLASMRQQVYQ